MPLSSSSLENALADVFAPGGHPDSTAAAGQAWANAYKDYASGASAGPTTPLAPMLTAAGAALATALGGAFDAALQGGASAFAQAADLAFVAFWAAVPFSGGPIVGTALGLPGAGAALLSAFDAGVNGAGARDQAGALAGALDTWTRTVMVTNVTPAGVTTVSPLT